METDQNVYFLLFIIFLYYSLINLFIFKYDYKKKKKKKKNHCYINNYVL